MKRLIATLFAAAAGHCWSGYCYEVFGPTGDVVYRSTLAPVDMSQPLASELAARGWHGYHLTFYPDRGACVETRPTAPGVLGPHRSKASGEASVDGGDVGLSAVLQGLAERNSPPIGLDGGDSVVGHRAIQTVRTGPRGGRYVITSGGHRRYVSRGSR